MKLVPNELSSIDNLVKLYKICLKCCFKASWVQIWPLYGIISVPFYCKAVSFTPYCDSDSFFRFLKHMGSFWLKLGSEVSQKSTLIAKQSEMPPISYIILEKIWKIVYNGWGTKIKQIFQLFTNILLASLYLAVIQRNSCVRCIYLN